MGTVRKVYVPETLKALDEQFTIEAVISTETIDRHGDIVKADGIDITNYMKHPVLLSSHRYDDLRKQIGVVEELRREGKKWIARMRYFVGEGNEEADWGYRLAKKGVAAFSIGFLPKEIDEIEKGERRHTVFKKSELLEISQVLVPANPEAVQQALSGDDEVMRMVAKAVDEELKGEGWSITGAPDLPISDDSSWDGAKAREEARKYASSDGSGDKEKIDWGKYGKFFVVGKRGSKNFGDYKLPFARVRDGKMVATRGGVIYAMASVLGARGGVDLPEDVKRRAYNFLAKYYRKFGDEPPEYGKDIDIIEFIIQSVGVEKRGGDEEVIKLLLLMEAKVEELSLRVEELAQAIGSRPPSPTPGGEPKGQEEGEALQGLLRELKELRKTIGGKRDGTGPHGGT